MGDLYETFKKFVLKISTFNIFDDEEVNVKITLFDKNDKILTQKNDTTKVNTNVASYPFVIEDIAKEKGVEVTDVAKASLWIDNNGDGIVEYDEELIMKFPQIEDASFYKKITKQETTTNSQIIKYTIKSGDTLSKIANKYHVHYRDISKDNNISNPDSIRVGQILDIKTNAQSSTEKIEYEKITKANLNDEIYIIVKTINSLSNDIDINIKTQDDDIFKVLVNNEEKEKIISKIIKENDTINTEHTIVKIKLRPKSDDDFETLKDKFQNDKKYKLKLVLSNDKIKEIEFDNLLEVSNVECIKITKEMLNIVSKKGNDEELLKSLNKLIKVYNICTKYKLAHFLSQIGHETSFKIVSEGIHYRHKTALIFSAYSKYYNNLKDKSKNIYFPNKQKYCKQPEFFDLVYGSRMGNNGEGYKFRGRGLIQLTGRNNYKMYTKKHNEKFPNDIKDFEKNPDLLITNKIYGIESAFVYWDNVGMNDISNSTDVSKVTKRINGGYNGLKERENNFKIIIKIIEGK